MKTERKTMILLVIIVKEKGTWWSTSGNPRSV
jgi:hypothetical protein